MAWLKKVSVKMASKDFNKAFAAARKELGAGKTFTWNGKSYSTNLAGEDKPKGFSVDMAKKAIDKAVGPKPMKRPAMATSKDAPMQTSPRPPKKPTEMMPVAKSIKVAKTGDITVSKLAPVAKTKVAGRPEGKAAGMPQNKSVMNYEAMIKSGKASASEIRSAKAALAILRKEAGMPTPKTKPTYDTTPAKGRMVVDQKLWNKPPVSKAPTTGTMTKAMKNYEAILNSSTASASEKRSAKAALAMLKGSE